jgi:hypothetical protein
MVERSLVFIGRCLRLCGGTYLTRVVDIGSWGSSLGVYEGIVLGVNLTGPAPIFLYSLVFSYIALIC